MIAVLKYLKEIGARSGLCDSKWVRKDKCHNQALSRRELSDTLGCPEPESPLVLTVDQMTIWWRCYRENLHFR